MILQTKKNTKHRLLTIDYIFKQNHMDKKKNKWKRGKKIRDKKGRGKSREKQYIINPFYLNNLIIIM